MNLLKKFTWLILIATVALSVKAQEKTKPDSVIKFSLKEAQNYAFQNNRSILNADLDVEMAKKKVWETTSMGFPTVSAKGSFQYMPTISPTIQQFSGLGLLPRWIYFANKYLSQQTGDTRNFYLHANDTIIKTVKESALKWGATADITVSQLIFSGEYIVGLQSAKVYKNLYNLNKVKSTQDVLESVSDSYFNALIAKENISILDTTYNNMEKTLLDILQMAKQGFSEETDVDQIRITLANVKSSRDMVVRLYDITLRLLKIQLGIDIDGQIELTDDLGQLLNSQTYDQLLLTDFVLEKNINYQLLDEQVKVTSLVLKLRKSEAMPSLAAFYQYEKNFNTNSITFNPPNLFGVTLNVPIFSSGARWSRIKQAKWDWQKSINSREENGDMIKLQFYQSKSSLINARDKYNSDKSNLELAKKIYDRDLIKFKNGMMSSLELTQAQNQYLTTQSSYYQSIQNLITEKNKIEKLLTKN